MNSSSSASVTSWRFEDCRTWRSSSPRRTISCSASFGSVCTSSAIECSALKRKCGLSWLRSASSCAWCSMRFQLHRLHLAVARLAVVSRGIPGQHHPRVHRQIHARIPRHPRQPLGRQQRGARFTVAHAQMQRRLQPPDQIGDERLREHGDRGAEQQGRRAQAPAPQAQTSAPPEHRGRHHPPREPVDRFGGKGARPRLHVAGDKELRSEYAGQQQPQTGVDQPSCPGCDAAALSSRAHCKWGQTPFPSKWGLTPFLTCVWSGRAARRVSDRRCPSSLAAWRGPS